MAKTKKITLGEKASYFHDPYTGITLAKGEVKEVPEFQLRTKRIKVALSNGHITQNIPESVEPDVEDLEIMVKKITSMATSGKDFKKSAAAFNMEDLKAIAIEFDIEAEDDDTKETLVKAIFEKING